jgi:hypothetical protein
MGRSLWADRSALECTSPAVVEAIKGAHLLVERLGSWPTFEDFEIISLRLERGNLMKIFETKAWSKMVGPSLRATFYGFDIRYSHKDTNRKPTLITMRFSGFERFALDGFNHQNPICGLEIIFEYSENLKKNLFAVDWGGAGYDASFSCERVEVMAVKAVAS